MTAAAITAMGVTAISITGTARAGVTLQWDPDPTTPGAQGGDGIWNTDPAVTHWWDGANDVPYSNTSSTVAEFAGVGGNVTLATSAVGSLIFDQPGYNIGGAGSLSVYGGGVTTNADATISANISAFDAYGGLIKTGAGTLRIAALHPIINYSVYVNQGALRLDTTPSSVTGSNLNVAQGGAFLANTAAGTSLAFAAIRNSGTFTISPATTVVCGASFIQNDGLLDIQGGFSMPGNGTFIYGAGTISGVVQIPGNLGTAQFNANALAQGNGTFNFTGGGGTIFGTVPAATTVNLGAYDSLGGTFTLFGSWHGSTMAGLTPAANNGTVNIGTTDTNHGVSLSWSGTVTNSGALNLNPALSVDAPLRVLNGTLSNTPSGSVLVNSSGTITTLQNNGITRVAAEKSLTTTSTTLSGGTLDILGSLSASTFTYNSGTVNGAVTMTGASPVLNFPKSAAPSVSGGTFILNSLAAVTGSAVPSSVTVDIIPNSSASVTFTTFPTTSSGTVVLSSSGFTTNVYMNNGSFTNAGTLIVNPTVGGPGDGGGMRSFSGPFTNTSTALASFNTDTTLTTTAGNSGQLFVAAGQTLTCNGSFTQSGGTLTLDGTLVPKDFTYSGGTVSGNLSLFASNVSGSLPSGLTATAFSGVTFNASNAFTNSGNLVFSSYTNTTIGSTSSVPFVNNGSISFVVGSGGTHSLTGSVTNGVTGSITSDSYPTMTSIVNQGQVTVLPNRALTLTGSFSQLTGSTLTVNGTFSTPTFTYSGGNITGWQPVQVTSQLSLNNQSGTLHSADFLLSGGVSQSISGNLDLGINITCQPAGSGGNYTYSMSGQSNSGTIVLSSSRNSIDQYVTLACTTLQNSGTLTTVASPGDVARSFSGSITNNATGVINANARTVFAGLTNAGSINVAAQRTLVINNPGLLQDTTATVTAGAGSTLDLANLTLRGGTISLAADPFTPARILLRGELDYSDASNSAQIITTPVPPGQLAGKIDLADHLSTWTIGDSPNPVDLDLGVALVGSSSAGLIKSGAGTLNLSGKNTFGKQLSIDQGTVTVASDSNLGSFTAILDFAGGTLKTLAAISAKRHLTTSGGAATWDSNGFDSAVGDIDAQPNDGFNKLGAGSLTANYVHCGQLHLVQGKLVIRPGGKANGVSYLNNLLLDPGTALDLNDNDLVVNNGQFQPLEDLVFQGYRQAPDPNATGIISTTGQTAPGNPMLALFDNALVGASDYPFGSGQTISANAIVGMYTFVGDTNWDGSVTADDYGALDANLGASGVPAGLGWFVGDTNFDGAVTSDDYGALDANLGRSLSPALSPNGLAVIPEPATSIAFLLALPLVQKCRRRSRPCTT